MNQNFTKNVLITGVSSYLGLALARQLLKNPGIGTVAGADVNELALDT